MPLETQFLFNIEILFPSFYFFFHDDGIANAVGHILYI